MCQFLHLLVENRIYVVFWFGSSLVHHRTSWFGQTTKPHRTSEFSQTWTRMVQSTTNLILIWRFTSHEDDSKKFNWRYNFHQFKRWFWDDSLISRPFTRHFEKIPKIIQDYLIDDSRLFERWFKTIAKTIKKILQRWFAQMICW